MNKGECWTAWCFDPVARRSWLLFKALECLPLDRAIDLALRAEEFIVGPSSAQGNCALGAPSGSLVVSAMTERKQPSPHTAADPPYLEKATAPIRTRLALPAAMRDKLIDRLAAGAKNSELAVEFGLTSKQVQGVRIGCARKISKRRTGRESNQTLDNAASTVDDVVRYLRQQDDVVVPQLADNFLVNGRFRLPLSELVDRANRMRARQGKPGFTLNLGFQNGMEVLVDRL